MLRARLFIAMQILIFHSLHNVNIISLHIRRCSLKKCFLWLDFNGDRKKTSLSPKLILLTPENKISNSLKVFFFFKFHNFIFHNNGFADSAGCEGSVVYWSTFSNTHKSVISTLLRSVQITTDTLSQIHSQ